MHPGKTRIVYCKDDDRTGKLSSGEVQFSWVHVSSPDDRRIGGESTSSTSPRPLAMTAAKKMRQEMRSWQSALSERQIDRRLGAYVESSPSRLDSVLRSLLQVRACTRRLRHFNRTTCPLGHEEIQTLAGASSSSGVLARRGIASSRPSALCPLASAARAEAGGWMMGAG